MSARRQLAFSAKKSQARSGVETIPIEIEKWRVLPEHRRAALQQFVESEVPGMVFFHDRPEIRREFGITEEL